MSSSDLQETAIPNARARLLGQRHSLERNRTRSFLVAQTALLAISAIFASAADLFGMMTELVFYQSVAFCGMTGIITLLGWYLYHRRGVTTNLVVGLLYVDSVIALFFLYVAGEFESTIGLLTFPIIMAPIYAGRRHSWGLAAFQTFVYLNLMACRQYGVLPYGDLLPKEVVTNPAFVTDSIASFLVITFGVAYLAGRASLDIITSKQQLGEAVERQTHRLAQSNANLHTATRALEDLNEALAERNDQLATINAQLQSSNQALAQFNAAVSHDLRAPLQSMKGTLELLEMTEPELADRQKKRLLRLDNAIGRMEILIRELHKLSQISDRLGDLKPVLLDEVLRATQQDLEAHLKARRVSLEVVHPLPGVMANASLLKEVLQNLIDNSIKYGNPLAPRVRVEATPAPPGFVAFAVEDNGLGIDPSEEHLVFRLFTRLERHKSGEGTGAGLAIVQRIVQAHGGSIRIERGQSLSGARFVVELPAPDEEMTEEMTEEILIGNGQPRSGHTILHH